MKVCVGCVYEYDWAEPLTAIPEGCKGCKMVDGKPSNYKQKPQTNADRIRAMSDEELIKKFGHNSICDYVQDHSSKHCEDQGSCEGCLLKWLKEPVEVDNG